MIKTLLYSASLATTTAFVASPPEPPTTWTATTSHVVTVPEHTVTALQALAHSIIAQALPLEHSLTRSAQHIAIIGVGTVIASLGAKACHTALTRQELEPQTRKACATCGCAGIALGLALIVKAPQFARFGN